MWLPVKIAQMIVRWEYEYTVLGCPRSLMGWTWTHKSVCSKNSQDSVENRNMKIVKQIIGKQLGDNFMSSVNKIRFTDKRGCFDLMFCMQFVTSNRIGDALQTWSFELSHTTRKLKSQQQQIKQLKESTKPHIFQSIDDKLRLKYHQRVSLETRHALLCLVTNSLISISRTRSKLSVWICLFCGVVLTWLSQCLMRILRGQEWERFCD